MRNFLLLFAWISVSFPCFSSGVLGPVAIRADFIYEEGFHMTVEQCKDFLCKITVSKNGKRVINLSRSQIGEIKFPTVNEARFYAFPFSNPTQVIIEIPVFVDDENARKRRIISFSFGEKYRDIKRKVSDYTEVKGAICD